MSHMPLMPKATAVWLIDNTALSFRQIADFCKLHELEVKGIADGEVAVGIKGMDPVTASQLTREEIEKGEKDPSYTLQLARPKVDIPITRQKKGPKYTPVSRRQDRPDAITWLLRYHPELPDSQIMKLVGTTKTTILAIRERTHWNSANLKPVDPVTLGLCSQLELDLAVRKAADKVRRSMPASAAGTLAPAEETVPPAYLNEIAEPEPVVAAEPSAASAFKDFTPASRSSEPEEAPVDAESVFAKLKDLKPKLGTGAGEASGESESGDETAKD